MENETVCSEGHSLLNIKTITNSLKNTIVTENGKLNIPLSAVAQEF